MRRRIVITGATGFLGSYLAKAFIQQGDSVAILTRPTSPLKRLEGILSHLERVSCDKEALRQYFHKNPVDAIIHTAVDYGRKGSSLEAIVQSNLLFPLWVLEESIAHQVPVFINTATPLNRQINSYALSKHQFAEWGRHFSQQGKIRFVDLFLQQMIGPGDDTTKFTTHLLHSCLKNVPALPMTEGKQKRDFIYIDDVVSAYQTVLDHALNTDETYLSFDVGLGQAIAMRSFAELVLQLADSKTQMQYGAISYRDNEEMICEANLSSLNKLGWKPQFPLEDAITRTLEAFK